MLDKVIVVTDASCFILLQKVEALFILEKLFGVVYTTPQVAGEYRLPLPAWVSVITPQDNKLLHTYKEVLDNGEASAMVLANEIEADLIIIDDGQARSFAKRIGINVTGSIGVLLLAKQNKVIPELSPYLDNIQQTNFRISEKILNEVRMLAGE
jgi:predicted nucleic acid-binding protein